MAPAADKNCADFPSQAAAQAYFASIGGSATNNADDLDANHNGIACEDYNYPAAGTPSAATAPLASGLAPAADKNCGDFPSQAAAQAYFASIGGSATNNADDLDANHNGIACEDNKYGTAGTAVSGAAGTAGLDGRPGAGLRRAQRRGGHRRRIIHPVTDPGPGHADSAPSTQAQGPVVEPRSPRSGGRTETATAAGGSAPDEHGEDDPGRYRPGSGAGRGRRRARHRARRARTARRHRGHVSVGGVVSGDGPGVADGAVSADTRARPFHLGVLDTDPGRGGCPQQHPGAAAHATDAGRLVLP